MAPLPAEHCTSKHGPFPGQDQTETDQKGKVVRRLPFACQKFLPSSMNFHRLILSCPFEILQGAQMSSHVQLGY